MNLHQSMYDHYTQWRKKDGGIYAQLKSDNKMIGELIRLFKIAIEQKQGVTPSSDDIFKAWGLLLANWQKLSNFHQRRRELKHIVSDFNILLNQLKNGTHQKNTTKHGSAIEAIAHFRNSKT